MKHISIYLSLIKITKSLGILFCLAVISFQMNAQPYTLTISRGGSGAGTVSSAPAGIDCGSTCTAVFAEGTTVTITATPNATSSFTGWSGAASGSNSTQTITMNSNKSVSANFTQNSYTLTVSKSGTGNGTITSSPAGINCGTTCSASYTAGSSITLTATPDAGSVFNGWTGGGCSGTGTCVVTMWSANSVTADFTYTASTYYADNDGDTYGAGDAIIAVTQPPNTSINNLDCDDGNSSVHPGAEEICSNGIDENCNGQIDECSQFALTISKGGSGAGTISSSPAGIDCGSTCTAFFAAGTTVTITAVPNATSSFTGWSGAVTGSNSTQTITMDSDKSVNANFTQNSYVLTISKSGTGTGTVTSSPAGINCGTTCSASYTAGSNITLTATPDAGSVFTGWTGGGCSGTGTCVVAMSSANSVTASFCQLPSQPEAISGNNPVCSGTSQIYSIAPLSNVTGYTWTLPMGWTGSSTTNSITATAGNTGVITVKGYNSCGSGPARTLNVTVNNTPLDQHNDNGPAVSVSYEEICENGSVNISIENSQNGITYQLLKDGDDLGIPQIGNSSTLIFSSGNLSSTALFSVKASNSTSTCTITLDTLLEVNVDPVYAFNENYDLCNGESYSWHGTNYSNAGTYTASYTTIKGCDSIYTLNLVVNPAYAFVEDHTLCEGETYSWQDNEYTVAGTYTAIYSTIHGCDSIYTLNLVVNSAYSFVEDHTLCEGETYSWQDNEYTVAGTYTATYTTIHGCDSIYTLNLNVNTVDVSVTINANVITSNMDGATYQWINCDNSNAYIINETSQSYTATSDGHYSVEITYGSCTDTSSCIEVITLGVAGLPEEVVSIYPNPVSDKLFICVKGIKEYTNFEILNSMGQVVYRGIFSGMTTLEATGFDPGVYLIKLKINNTFSIRKFIIE